DAEGEEERILAGGRAFFARLSPLVMFEVKAGDSINKELLMLFPAMGYRLYRQLAGAPILVPSDPSQPLDGYELNLFAAKPDRAAALAERGLLVDSIPSWEPGDVDLRGAQALWRSQPFASPASAFGRYDRCLDADYQRGLAGYATWRNNDHPATTRCA